MTDEDRTVSDSLTDAIVALNAELDLASVLDRFLKASLDHTGATMAAINVLDDAGTSVDFHYAGVDRRLWEMMRRAPNAVGVLAQIPIEGALVIDEVTKHPSFGGLPPGHPTMGPFLGVSLQIRGHVFGYLYLANKPSPFTPRDVAVVTALASAASVAIDNAELYEAALEREKWLTASQEITTTLLADPGDEGAITRIVEAAKELSHARTGVLVLPGMNDAWVMELTTGDRAADLLGLELPEGGHALEVIRGGVGTIAPEPPGNTLLDQVRGFGPSLYAPLRIEGRAVGLLMLWRQPGDPLFDSSDLATAERFAAQAALALSVAELRHVKNVTALLAERQRIADDLHDLVSQELFATSIQMETLADMVPPELRTRVLDTLEHVHRAQKEVRGVVQALAEQRSAEPLADRLRREVVLAKDALGFAPVMRGAWDDLPEEIEDDISLADDLVAVVRESLSNVARHARATSTEVMLVVEDDRLRLTVTDDGLGAPASPKRHSGISNLANRALRRNGVFDVRPARPGEDPPGTVAEWNVRWRES